MTILREQLSTVNIIRSRWLTEVDLVRLGLYQAYEADGVIWYNWHDLAHAGLDFILIEDSTPEGEISTIDSALIRWNNEDGLYHA